MSVKDGKQQRPRVVIHERTRERWEDAVLVQSALRGPLNDVAELLGFTPQQAIKRMSTATGISLSEFSLQLVRGDGEAPPAPGYNAVDRLSCLLGTPARTVRAWFAVRGLRPEPYDPLDDRELLEAVGLPANAILQRRTLNSPLGSGILQGADTAQMVAVGVAPAGARLIRWTHKPPGLLASAGRAVRGGPIDVHRKHDVEWLAPLFGVKPIDIAAQLARLIPGCETEEETAKRRDPRRVLRLLRETLGPYPADAPTNWQIRDAFGPKEVPFAYGFRVGTSRDTVIYAFYVINGPYNHPAYEVEPVWRYRSAGGRESGLTRAEKQAKDEERQAAALEAVREWSRRFGGGRPTARVWDRTQCSGAWPEQPYRKALTRAFPGWKFEAIVVRALGPEEGDLRTEGGKSASRGTPAADAVSSTTLSGRTESTPGSGIGAQVEGRNGLASDAKGTHARPAEPKLKAVAAKSGAIGPDHVVIRRSPPLVFGDETTIDDLKRRLRRMFVRDPWRLDLGRAIERLEAAGEEVVAPHTLAAAGLTGKSLGVDASADDERRELELGAILVSEDRVALAPNLRREYEENASREDWS